MRLTAAPGITFNVLDVKSTIPGLHTAVIPIQEGTQYKIVLSIKEDFKADSLEGQILIETDDESQKTIAVDVFGRAFKERPIGKSAGPEDKEAEGF